MSFQMTHMEIAYKVAGRLSLGEERKQFILGSVAPDSVHFRDDFVIEHKIHSHLFEECGEWSDTQDYERWMQNIGDFWDKYGEGETDKMRRAFILGICAHCVTDYCNDLYIWRALEREYIPPMTREDFRSEYYPEARDVDKWLFQESPNAKEIVALLEASDEMDFYDYIRAIDQVKMKDHLINVQYNLPDKVDVTGYKYYPSDKILWFVDTVSDKVFDYLQARIDKK